MAQGAYIFAPLGETLTPDEKQFFARANPWGFILFARNVDNPDQLSALTSDLRACVGRDAPVLIDQEGGRVQRMTPPHWRSYLPALDQMNAAKTPMRAHWIRNRLIASELFEVGIDVNCAPLGDVLTDDTHAVLANRLSGDTVETVVEAAKVCVDAFLQGGILPVLKHIPGHGRATIDSHLDVPHVSESKSVLSRQDFRAFEALNTLPMGMTAHLIFEAIDPDHAATQSPAMVDLIRREIGFDGLLMTDDISMNALKGDVATRSRAAIAAGCDVVLHCNGNATEMAEIADAIGPMELTAQVRADVALLQRTQPSDIDISALAAELEALLA